VSPDPGLPAEDAAAGYLRSRGYKVLDRRWACPLGELDIVAFDSGTLVFVEVRSRSASTYGSPAETVTKAKQKKVIKAALTYLKAKALAPETVRFDVIVFEGGTAAPEHIINAFQADGYTF
jgi:putative endonuclease